MGKVYYIILDGAADRFIKLLGNKTPLEVAEKPNLDAWASNGRQSLIEILPNGLAPESDSGAMALLGYDPFTYYCGRGSLEVLGTGDYISHKYFVGFRTNFASLNNQRKTLDRRVARGLSAQELQCLTKKINEDVVLENFPGIGFNLRTFGSFRGSLCFFSEDTPLSGNVSNTDPGYGRTGYFSIPINNYSSEIMPCRAQDSTNAARTTARLVNDFSRECINILMDSNINQERRGKGLIEANCILIRDGGGNPIPMEAFEAKYGKTLSIYGQLPSEKAIANMIGAHFFLTETFEHQKDPEWLMDLADQLAEDVSDVVFCHLKGPDEPGHDNKPMDKVKAIETIDTYFFGQLRTHICPRDVLIVTCDHATPCELGIHSNDFVPLLIYGSGFERDDTESFCERAARNGAYRVKKAVEIMDDIKGVV